MILFFGSPKLKIFAVEISEILLTEDLKKLSWVLDSRIIDRKQISEKFIGPKSAIFYKFKDDYEGSIEKKYDIKQFNPVTDAKDNLWEYVDFTYTDKNLNENKKTKRK